MKCTLRRLTCGLGILVVLAAGAFAAVIAFDSPAAPPILAAGNTIPGIAQWNFAELPKVQSVKARGTGAHQGADTNRGRRQ